MCLRHASHFLTNPSLLNFSVSTRHLSSLAIVHLDVPLSSFCFFLSFCGSHSLSQKWMFQSFTLTFLSLLLFLPVLLWLSFPLPKVNVSKLLILGSVLSARYPLVRPSRPHLLLFTALVWTVCWMSHINFFWLSQIFTYRAHWAFKCSCVQKSLWSSLNIFSCLLSVWKASSLSLIPRPPWNHMWLNLLSPHTSSFAIRPWGSGLCHVSLLLILSIATAQVLLSTFHG